MQEKYNVTGMTCAACQARVQKSVSNLTGVPRPSEEAAQSVRRARVQCQSVKKQYRRCNCYDCRTDWAASSDGRGNHQAVSNTCKKDDGTSGGIK